MGVSKTVLIGSLLLGSAGVANAIELPDGFVDEAFVTGLSGVVTAFDPSSDGRIFISEQAGVVRVVANGVLLDEPFLDINEIVNSRVDRGMLSVAVHPQFPVEPYVYVLYTYDPVELAANTPGDSDALDGDGSRVSRLVRYTADAAQDFNVALANSEEIILGKNSTFAQIGNPAAVFDTQDPSCGTVANPTVDCLPIDEVTHTIGALRFASDESLYVTNGDGSSFRTIEPHTQLTLDLDSLRGKLMRIDPDTGLGLSDNPFYDGNPASNRSRVVSYGLRNPYSLVLHPVTGVPFVGDVGQEAWEEINAGGGFNFGWPCYEGGPNGNLQQTDGFADEDFCQTLYASGEAIEEPLISWQHDGLGNAGVIGEFYFGSTFPENFTGALFYGDFIKGWLRYADISNPANVIINEFATDMLPMTEIRVGTDGSLYYASVTTAEIRRIRYDADLAARLAASGPVTVGGALSTLLLILTGIVGLRTYRSGGQ